MPLAPSSPLLELPAERQSVQVSVHAPDAVTRAGLLGGNDGTLHQRVSAR
ncbi:hypothetical protein ACIGXM_34975 [Kitasatospora sp. NPDC052896]